MPRRFALAILAISSCTTEPADKAEDGVAIYRALIGKFPKLPKVVQDAFDGRSVDPPELESAILSYAPLLDEVACATRARRCDWSYDTPPIITTEYPLDYALIAGRLLSVRAARRRERGDLPGSLSDLSVLSKFGSDLQQDRAIIGRLIGIICMTLSCDGFQVELRGKRLNREDLERVRSHLELLVRRYPPFDSVLRDERNAAISLIDEIVEKGFSAAIRRITKEDGEGKEDPWMVHQWEDRFRAVVRKDPQHATQTIVGRWDEQMFRLSSYLKGPLNSRPKTFTKEDIMSKEQMERMGIQTLGVGSDEQFLRDAADLLFLLWVPALTKAPPHFAKGRLMADLTRLGCLMELHRLKNNAYPETLKDLGEPPEDPFDGGQLKYRRVMTPEGEGYVLTAAGPQEDHETRMRVLAEDCRFDKELFDKKGYEFDSFTIWSFHRR